MTFRSDAIDQFKALFENHKQAIASQPGCQHLQLMHDIDDPRIFMTYSHWDDQECLDQYRNSTLFGIVWPRTKELFEENPEAWSLDMMETQGPP